MKFLTIDDFDLKGKTVFLRVDMNCPIDPETLEISGTKRIEEIVETKRPDLTAATQEAAERTIEGSCRSAGIKLDY